MRLLLLGSKAYPLGTNKGDDPQPSGGIEVYVETLVEKLSREKNIEFTIITRHFKNTKKHEQIGNIDIYRVGWLKGFYFRNLTFNFIGFIKAISLKFDIIFTQDLFATFFGIFLSKLKKKPLISVVHGIASDQPQYPSFLRYVLQRLEIFTYQNVEFTISLTVKPKNKFMELGGKAKNWRVIPFGIKMERFDGISRTKTRKNLGLKKEVAVITFVGRLLKVKGVSYLIDALSLIEEDFVALIVGSGPDEAELKRLVNEKGLTNKVRFLGFRDNIPEILRATDIYVLPSLSEGLSISLFEARAAGCACVVTDIGLPVKPGKDALVVIPGDAEALREGLELLLKNNDLRERLGREGRKMAVNSFSWDNIMESYLEVFKEIVER